MWTGLTDSPGVTVEPGEPGVIGVPSEVSVPGLPGVVGGTGHRVPVPGTGPVPGPGVTGTCSEYTGRLTVTAEPTLLSLTGRYDRCRKKRVFPPGVLIQTEGGCVVQMTPR